MNSVFKPPSKLLPLFTDVKMHHISSKKLTPSQYAQVKVVESFCNLVFYCKQSILTNISWILKHSADIEGTWYKVNEYITIRLLPFKEFCEE
jgi:hypothetical protein